MGEDIPYLWRKGEELWGRGREGKSGSLNLQERRGESGEPNVEEEERGE